MPSDDYIKRSDARAYVRHAHGKGLNLMECIDAIPAADVEPVRHGKWIPINRINPAWGQFGVAQHKCSECGSEEVIARKRCPECGAKMMGEEDDGNEL